MTYFINWKDKGVFLKFNKTLNVSDIIEANGKIYGDIQFEYCDYYICDMLDVDNVEMIKDEARTISKIDFNASKWNYTMKLAMVTTNNEIIELVNEYKDYLKATNWDVKIVSSISEAKEWVEC